MASQPEKQKKRVQPTGLIDKRDTSHMIFLAATAVILLIALFAMPAAFKNKKTALKNEAPAFNQMEDFSHSKAPTPAPAPEPFISKDGIFDNIIDCSASNFVPLETEAEDYLLHQARTQSKEEHAPNTSVGFEALTSNPTQHRGEWVTFSGSLAMLQPRSVKKPGHAKLTEIWEGLLVDANGRDIFFSLASYPLNIYIPDQVIITGTFLKIHGDPSTLKVAPLIITNSLTLQGPTDLNLDSSVLKKLVRDDDPEKIEKISPGGRAFLLHKLRSHDKSEMVQAIDRKIDAQNMIQQPREVRGKAVEIKGILLWHPERERLYENQSGLRNVYTGYMGDSDNNIYRFTVINPPLIQKADAITLRGYFLQRMSHRDKNNNRRLTPMIVGYEILKRNEYIQPSGDDPVIWVGASIAFLVIISTYFLMQMENRSSANFISAVRKTIQKPKINLNQSGRKLTQQRTNSIQAIKQKKKDQK